MVAPPPAPVRKPTPWALIILILSAGLAVIVGLGVFVGYQVFNVAKQAPKAREGFGKPEIVATLEGGWKRYRFPEVPMTIDLPDKPEPDELRFEPGSLFFTQSWIYYQLRSEANWIELTGQWYHDKEDVDLEVESGYAVDWVKESQEATNIVVKARKATIGDLSGREVTGTCISDGEKMNFRFFYWTRDKAVFIVHTYAWSAWSKEGSQELERIVKSIKM